MFDLYVYVYCTVTFSVLIITGHFFNHGVISTLCSYVEHSFVAGPVETTSSHTAHIIALILSITHSAWFEGGGGATVVNIYLCVAGGNI